MEKLLDNIDIFPVMHCLKILSNIVWKSVVSRGDREHHNETAGRASIVLTQDLHQGALCQEEEVTR